MTPETKLRIIKNLKPLKRVETYATTLYDRIVRPLMQAGIDRKDRFIYVCFRCHKYESDGEWIDGAIPPGIQSKDGFCPECFESLLGTQNSLFNSVTKSIEPRFIRVCCSCGRWWTGNGWQVSNMPIGKYTDAYWQIHRCLLANTPIPIVIYARTNFLMKWQGNLTDNEKAWQYIKKAKRKTDIGKYRVLQCRLDCRETRVSKRAFLRTLCQAR